MIHNFTANAANAWTVIRNFSKINGSTATANAWTDIKLWRLLCIKDTKEVLTANAWTVVMNFSIVAFLQYIFCVNV
ncbi:hypothetical protein RhiirA5_355481 [Rhizophagus irregularis]|uniref:Uncharacterized protein n=1 Tax=Rhizophagus irregularis TaxID=588596 RepID=A0A2I1FCN4_9GLOM|nr:hypothetical protein RhiirA5_355481 [Rhizophagus irregularis]PKC57698.1 hypothetical protein RhiirA1_428307 [Rhizophagus irregularis]PKK61449.1 hypothetical protein RhiirC2_760694 [Rhizophagus irregularis]PKY32106.1 hypothetical protein RhiirB3_419936 [Rhizophagus irregularis]